MQPGVARIRGTMAQSEGVFRRVPGLAQGVRNVEGAAPSFRLGGVTHAVRLSSTRWSGGAFAVQPYQPTQAYINMARQMDQAVAALHVPDRLEGGRRRLAMCAGERHVHLELDSTDRAVGGGHTSLSANPKAAGKDADAP